MAGSLKNIGLTSLDDLFKTDEQRQADAQERVQIVPADQVFPYARQPYSIDRPTQGELGRQADYPAAHKPCTGIPYR